MEVNVFAMKSGDLEPPLEAKVSGSRGDLNTVNSWRVVGRQGGEVLFTDLTPEKDILSPTSAVIRHIWEDGQTDVLGPIEIDVVAVWPGNREQTFPPQGFSKVWIFESID